ncbi:MAG: SUMF1/EgtB/PvdO family nonheme iron enzyme [Candidatus Tectomicrobia bacterium]|nr:SUMF1/EgtB/PvdO family nonheme iron enzyme [Candidatus Tectomicrobia bacterium]
MIRRCVLLCTVLHLCCMALAAWSNPANGKGDEGDLVLPMPHGLQMVFRPVFIGAGGAPFALRKFSMGDPAGGYKENLTNVVIGGAFKQDRRGQPEWLYYLGKHEVTEAQYAAIMEPQETDKKASQYPIRDVSWFDVQRFIDRYNRWLFEHAKDALPQLDNAAGYLRLPTEIEWEFAVRGGAEAGNDLFDARSPYIQPLSKHEWFAGPSSSHDKVQKVGLLEPNPLHLHDLLGNVSEMTASFYQIEYYQGRVGGFVARGGNYTTSERKMRSSLRSEQPFYRRDLQPQRSPTLGFRLTLSSIIFASRQTSRELRAAWPDYRAGGVGATGPAAVSVAPPSTQTNLQLADAAALVERLMHSPNLPGAAKRDLELLQASFDNIEATVKEAEVDSAYAWVEIAATRALFVSRSLKQVPGSRKVVAMAKRVGKTAMQEKLRKRLNDLLQEIDEMVHRYSDSLRQLDRNNVDAVERAIRKYRDQLVSSGSPDRAERIRIVNDAVKKHFMQFTKSKRAQVETWKTDLENL